MKGTAPSIAPTLPTAFSSLSGLGAPVGFFRPSQRSRVVPLACAGACALGAAVSLAYGLAASAAAYSFYGWAVVQQLGRIPVMVFWLFVLAGLLFGLYALLMWSKAVALYEGGIAFRSMGGIRSWDWGDVAALYVAVAREAGLFPRTRHHYTLEHDSGERASFDDSLERVTELGSLLGHQIVARHYARTAERFNAGEPASFGQIRIDQKGIQLREKSAQWGGIEFISVRRGYFQIHAKDGTVGGLPVASIPNLDVLLLLLDHIIDLRLEE